MISSIFPPRQRFFGVVAGGTIRSLSWKWIVAVLAALVAIWLLYHALAARAFDWRVALFSFTHVRLGWLLLAVAGVYSTYWGRALRWTVFLRPLKPRPSMRNLFSATIVGFTAVTLLGRPGEFVRPYLIAMKEKVPIASQLAAWVLERVCDLLMVLLLFGFALAHAGSSKLAAGSQLSWLLAAGGRLAGFLAVFLLVLLIFLRQFSQPFHRLLMRLLRFLPERISAALDRLVANFLLGTEATRSDGALLLVLLYSFVEWFLIAVTYWCLARSFREFDFTVVDTIVILGFVGLGAGIQIPGVGGGIQVAAVLVLTEVFGIRLEAATAFAFLVWAVTFVAVLPVGLAISVKEGLGWRKLRQAAVQESR